MKKLSFVAIALIVSVSVFSCQSSNKKENQKTTETSALQQKVNQYATVKLTTDLSQLTNNQKKMIPLLIKAAKVMDTLYWYQTYGDWDSLLGSLSDSTVIKYVKINVGPWDRLDEDNPFVKGVGEKPLGANFYPKDMTKEEFESADISNKTGLYNFIRRDSAGELYALPYNVKFKSSLKTAAKYLKDAAQYAETSGLEKYLNLRAKALLTDDFYDSDIAWLDMRDNTIGIVIGSIETYEDQLFGYKTSYEAYVLIKNKDWSKKLAKYAAYLPELQEGLPVPEKYKKETPGTDADLNVYDVLYYGGFANAGAKTIAINLPNSEKIQMEKGSRRLQLRNVMKAKFDKILVPIADILITPKQRKYIDFDAFFNNTMFHEVAHGLGIKNTLNGKGTVRKALKEYASALEEGKADVLGLYMIEQLLNKDVLQGDIKNFYTTFIASIFRSVRFGAGDAHGIANMVRFNYFKEQDAFTRLDDGTYKVNFDKMQDAVKSLSHLILTLQGNGDYAGVAKLVKEKGKIGPPLQKDLNRLEKANIPVDIIFEQGADVLELK